MDQISDNTKVPIALLRWLLGVMIAGLLAIGGIVVSFRVDVAVLKEKTGTIAQKLDIIAQNVDGLSSLRGRIDVLESRITSLEREVALIRGGK